MTRAALGFLIACSSHPAARDRPSPVAPGEAGLAADARAADAACAPGSKLENGRCDADRDCVLTDLPVACDACNLDQPYPALRIAFDLRTSLCATTPACAAGCPPHDTYVPAFYRAECREHRCVAWRYHGGG